MHVGRLPEHGLLDGKTFLNMHLQIFTHGLRLETLALSSASVTSDCICCIMRPILVTSTLAPSTMPRRRRFLVLGLSEHE